MIRPSSLAERYGRLLVLEVFSEGKSRRARVRCDCGAEKTVYCGHLRSGATTSCGCAWVDAVATHGATRGGRKPPPEYLVWKTMRARCENPRDPGFPRYGGRGIKVCSRWSDYAAFIADMGPRPSPRHSIDRIDNDRGYEPGNCRWATPAEQSRNTSRNIWVEIDGERLVLKDACARVGSDYHLARGRIKAGWDPLRAMTVPPEPDMQVGAEGVSLREAAKRAGVPYGTAKTRLRLGWPMERVLAQGRFYATGGR